MPDGTESRDSGKRIVTDEPFEAHSDSSTLAGPSPERVRGYLVWHAWRERGCLAAIANAYRTGWIDRHEFGLKDAEGAGEAAQAAGEEEGPEG